MLEDAFTLLSQLVRPADVHRIRLEDKIASFLPEAETAASMRFEGVYGSIYDYVIRASRLRRVIFRAWGSADPLENMDDFVADAVSTVADQPKAVLVDLPCGGGTLIPILQREAFKGTALEVDLAANMLARALRLFGVLQPGFQAIFMHADGLDLPLRDEVADLVVSINGLHVVDDPRRFLSEIARVAKPGGGLWIITPVDGPGVRSRVILEVARRLSITPRMPPTRPDLRRLFDEAGFDEVRDYCGESIAGFGLRRRAG
jgi:ubiquinone/menaquinone biosynthesis C-methylase UbiE